MAKPGRPTKYREEYAEQCYKLCLLGATDEDLAGFFEVSVQTLHNWLEGHPAFLEARKSGKEAADSNVADRLYQRATGYTHPEEKIFQYEGEPVRVETLKHYPPDTAAAIYWLNNRQRGRWSNRHLHELTGKDGGPIETRELSDEEVTKRLTDVRNRLVALTGAPSTNGRNGH